MTRVVPGGALRTRLLTGLAESAQWQLPPEEMIALYNEYDPTMLDMVIDDAYWDRIGDPGSGDTTNERRAMIRASNRAWRSSPLDQWTKWTWTAEGLGQGIDVKAADAGAQDRWDEFWTAERNDPLLGDDRLHQMSFDLLNHGNLFLAFYSSPADGETTIRDVDADEITEIICDPADRKKPWFYKREYMATSGTISNTRTLYYPDWALFFQPQELERAWTQAQEQRLVPDTATRADLVQQNGDLGDAAQTSVCVLHIAHNRKIKNSPWGWPLSTVSMPYARAHKQFIQATLSKVLSIAQFTRRSRVQGGSRAVNSVIDTVRSALSQNQRLDTNPPGAPGASWHVENQAVTTEELPMSTAAMDTDRDNKTLAWAALIGAGLFPATAGLDVARYATALTMDRVQAFVFSQYKSFWAAQIRKMFKIVMGYAGMSMEIEVEISIDSYGLPDFAEMVGPTTTLMQQITQAVTASILAPQDARDLYAAFLRPAVQALGASGITELLDFEEPPEPAPQPEQGQQAAAEEVLRLAAGHYERGEITFDALLEAVVATYTEGGKGSGWFGPDADQWAAYLAELEKKRLEAQGKQDQAESESSE